MLGWAPQPPGEQSRKWARCHVPCQWRGGGLSQPLRDLVSEPAPSPCPSSMQPPDSSRPSPLPSTSQLPTTGKVPWSPQPDLPYSEAACFPGVPRGDH